MGERHCPSTARRGFWHKGDAGGFPMSKKRESYCFPSGPGRRESTLGGGPCTTGERRDCVEPKLQREGKFGILKARGRNWGTREEGGGVPTGKRFS